MDDNTPQNVPQQPQEPQQAPAQQQSPQQPQGQQRPPLRIDNNLLDELGLGGLPAEEKAGFLKHIYETLEMRVGMRLADMMTNEQLDEFETFYNAKDDAGAFKWLETNFPNYKEIVADEFAKLKNEIAQSAPQILAASQQQAAQPQPGGAMPQQPQANQYPEQPMASQPQQMPPSPQTEQQPSQPPQPTMGQAMPSQYPYEPQEPMPGQFPQQQAPDQDNPPQYPGVTQQ